MMNFTSGGGFASALQTKKTVSPSSAQRPPLGEAASLGGSTMQVAMNKIKCDVVSGLYNVQGEKTVSPSSAHLPPLGEVASLGGSKKSQSANVT